jgi:putative ABC transport system permease protein
LGLRGLSAHRARVLLTMLGIALGVALQSAVSSINRSTLASFEESIRATVGRASLTVSAGEAGFPETWEDRLAALPGVASASSMIEDHVYLKTGSATSEPLMLFGVDLLEKKSSEGYHDTEAGDPIAFLSQPDSILLTRVFATSHRLKRGDAVEVFTTRGARRMVVRALATPEGPARAYGGAIVVMDIDAARRALGKEGRVDRIDLILKDGVNREEVRLAASGLLGPGFQVLAPEAQSDQLFRSVAAFQAMLVLLSGLALVVGVVLAFNSVAISVAQRRREIAMFRLLGATRANILAAILFENLVLGAFAGAAGAGLGRVLARGLLGLVTEALSGQLFTRVHVNRLDFGAREVVLSIVLGTAVSGLAALYPAIRAMRVAPLEALGVPPPERAPRGRRWFPVLGFVLLGGLFVFRNPSLPGANIVQPLAGVLGAALLVPAATSLALALMTGYFARGRNWIRRIAFENLRRSPGRTLANVFTTLVGLMLVVIVGAVHVSFRHTLVSWVDRVGAVGDLTVSSTGSLVQAQVQPLSEELLPEISAISGVSTTEERPIVSVRYIRVSYAGRSLAIKAIGRVSEKSGFKFMDAVEPGALESGHLLFDSATPTVLVSENFIRNFGAVVGQTIELATPNGALHARIAGTVRDYGNPDGVFYLDRRWLKQYWNDSLVTGYILSATPGTSVQELQRRINGTLGAKGLLATTNGELLAELLRSIDQAFAFNTALELAALLVGLVALINTMLVSVFERTRELGMLRAVGMERRQLAAMILWESIAQGTIGALSAVFIGSYLGWLWVTVNLSSALGWLIHYVFPWGAILEVLILGIIVSGIAGLVPAIRASRLELREALQEE